MGKDREVKLETRRVYDTIIHNSKYNISAFDDIQKYTQIISSILFDTILNAKSGYGFDTFDNYELKSCTLAQLKKCTCIDDNANVTRLSYFIEKCPICGNTIFEYEKGDSRWMIDTVAHFKYFDELNDYICYITDCVDIDTKRLRTRGFIIDKYNNNFNTYLREQYEIGKGNHINLMPYSTKFFLCAPKLFFEVEFDSTEVVININDVKTSEIFNITRESFEINGCALKLPHLKIILTDLKIPFKKTYNKTKCLDLLFEHNAYIDIKNIVGIKPVSSFNRAIGDYIRT